MNYKFDDLRQILDVLKSKIRIAVIYAGNKNDEDSVIYTTRNTRSWKSYKVVAGDIQNALIDIGFKNTIIIPENINIFETLKKEKIHMAWLNSAGVQGYNPMSHAPAVLELAGIPYVGHNPTVSTLLDNKHHFKRECISYGIPTGRSLAWDMTRGPLNPKLNSRFKSAFAGYNGPFIVKPVSGRASLHVNFVESIDELAATVTEVYEKSNNLILIEEYLNGKEYCVSVCGSIIHQNGTFIDHKQPFVFSDLERKLDKGEKIFTSMDVKPIDGSRAVLLSNDIPAEKIVSEKLQQLARDVYLDFNLNTLVRLDVRADVHGNLYVLEVNPKPDLKRFDESVVSLVAMGLQERGLSYNDLILSLLASRLDRLIKNVPDNVAHILKLL